jgi:hypothetical protein
MSKRSARWIVGGGFLATTSALALVAGGANAQSCGTLVSGSSFVDSGTLCPAISNNGSILGVLITNSGAIGATLQTTHFANAGSTFHSSIVNTGTIAQIPNIAAVDVQNSTLIGSIVNAGTIIAPPAGGIIVNNSILNTGGVDAAAILNSGLIIAGGQQRPGPSICC